jgi:hypothetical protein
VPNCPLPDLFHCSIKQDFALTLPMLYRLAARRGQRDPESQVMDDMPNEGPGSADGRSGAAVLKVGPVGRPSGSPRWAADSHELGCLGVAAVFEAGARPQGPGKPGSPGHQRPARPLDWLAGDVVATCDMFIALLPVLDRRGLVSPALEG